jgi:hypothetical protein
MIGKSFCIALIAACGLLTTAKSNAQSNQLIVMSCKNQYPEQINLIIDLTAKTVVEQEITPSAAGGSSQWQLTQITDQQIVWTEKTTTDAGTYGYTKTLNRYTGVLTQVPFGSINGNPRWGNITPFTCQKQPKQF